MSSQFRPIGSLLSLILALLGFGRVRNRPEDLGFESPNRYVNSDAGPDAPAPRHWLRSLGSVLMVGKLWPGFWVQFGMVGSLYAFMGLWGVPYLRDVHGLSREYAADHLTVMLLSFALGALFFGWFSDSLGKRKPLIIVSVLLKAGQGRPYCRRRRRKSTGHGCSAAGVSPIGAVRPASPLATAL